MSTSCTPSPPHPLRELWHYFSQNRGAVIGLVVVILLVLVALSVDRIAPHSPIEPYRDATLAPPMWRAGGSRKFILGNDLVGRDMLSRLVHRTWLSLVIGLVSVSLSLTIGVLLGLVAGFFRGVVEVALMRLMDVMLALPSLLLAVAVVPSWALA